MWQTATRARVNRYPPTNAARAFTESWEVYVKGLGTGGKGADAPQLWQKITLAQ